MPSPYSQSEKRTQRTLIVYSPGLYVSNIHSNIKSGKKWFNSIFNSKSYPKYSFNRIFIQYLVKKIQFKILFKKNKKILENMCFSNLHSIFNPILAKLGFYAFTYGTATPRPKPPFPHGVTANLVDQHP